MKPVTIRIKKKKLKAFKLMALVMAVVVGVFWIDSRIRPVIQMITTYQAKLAATRSINNAVIHVISEEDVVYNSIVSIQKDSEGEVSSLETDMITMNRLKSLVTNRVSEQLIQDAASTVRVPLGTLLGGQILSGRGPVVEFKVLPVGYVQTEIYNNFQSAGINQTLHQIMLKVTASVSAVIPVYTVTTDVTTNLCIAQTIIVGKVPEAYTDINGEKSDLLGQFNDYGAQLPE
ncbi:sporulation protein YunB [Marasmitruncus massiliensis]|jgi:sporulation protein YunB|uniref:sporulation protein YunB n=1 Tax=Marasmitruncus massiliensis TaxID=1944642 RepID=UPI000C79714A|nr:sporulation protein YunB [Marasmitruncus massiliensis]